MCGVQIVLEQQIGAGEAGVVYMCRWRGLQCAAKLLNKTGAAPAPSIRPLPPQPSAAPTLARFVWRVCVCARAIVMGGIGKEPTWSLSRRRYAVLAAPLTGMHRHECMEVGRQCTPDLAIYLVWTPDLADTRLGNLSCVSVPTIHT